MNRFRGRGARIGLDDLGVRAHDLTRVLSLRPDVIKIDRTLVATRVEVSRRNLRT